MFVVSWPYLLHFKYQGYWVRVKVRHWKMLILQPELANVSIRSRTSLRQGHSKVKNESAWLSISRKWAPDWRAFLLVSVGHLCDANPKLDNTFEEFVHCRKHATKMSQHRNSVFSSTIIIWITLFYYYRRNTPTISPVRTVCGRVLVDVLYRGCSDLQREPDRLPHGEHPHPALQLTGTDGQH